MPEQIGGMYGVRWRVELLFRELKSVHVLEKIRASDAVIIELLTVAALLTLVGTC